MTRLSPTKTCSSEGPQCPHCGLQITADDSYFYDERKYVLEKCPDCNKEFKVRVDTSITWFCDAIPGTSP